MNTILQSESPFDEKKTANPRPQRTYEYSKVYSERDFEFEAKVRSGQQYWRQKTERSASKHQRSRPYDFDRWFRAHYGNTFESEWYGSKTGNNHQEYNDFEQSRTWKRYQKASVRSPPEADSKISPYDFDYANPIEYTAQKQKSEEIDDFVNSVAIFVLLFVIMFSVRFIVKNAELDKNKLSEEVRLKK